MIWRLVICFSLAGLCFSSLPWSVQAATVSGVVTLSDSAQAAVKKKKNYSNVVVWLTGPAVPAPVARDRNAQMLQKDKMFSPHLLVVRTGTEVAFPNLDPIFHNAFSSFDGQVFDVALYPPGTSRSVQFDRPGIVRVFCNIHPSMSAIILVLNSAYFAKTDSQGHYTIPGVSPGTYQVHFFDERATPEELSRLQHTVTVAGDLITLDPATVSESGYLPTSHKNKYGRDYPAGSGSSDTYSWPGH